MKEDDPAAEITSEMRELDLQDGSEVTVLELDADSGWPIIQWTDSIGIERLTTVDPVFFDGYFMPV